MSSFKIALKRIPLIIFFVFTGLALISTYFTPYQYFVLSLEIILGVPLTMLQAGYALNYNANVNKNIFKSLGLKNIFTC